VRKGGIEMEEGVLLAILNGAFVEGDEGGDDEKVDTVGVGTVGADLRGNWEMTVPSTPFS